MKELFNRFQNPQTDWGRTFRDGVFFAVATGLVAFLQSIDTIDFGEYNALVSVVIGMIVPAINRLTRKK